MRVGVYILLCLLCAGNCFAQTTPPVRLWDYRYGGTKEEVSGNILLSPTGDLILGGATYSDSTGNKTQHNWDPSLSTADGYIVKLDSLGNKIWDKRFGGAGDDGLGPAALTKDNQYFFAGSSSSSVSYDKSEYCRGGQDFWMIKITSNGTKIWDKTYGGTSDDWVTQARGALDGGYIVAGISYSDQGADKSEPSRGGVDYWVVKIDSDGLKQWDKTLGGDQADFCYCVNATTDSGYVIGGISSSDSSGDKTAPSWNASYDFWMVKLDALGNKLWDKRYGGFGGDFLNSILQTKDNCFLLGGNSYSHINGDKTQDIHGVSNSDLWVIKTDSIGNKLWDKDYGSTGDDFMDDIISTSDGGYLYVAESNSPAGGDKTESSTFTQTWLIKVDSMGLKEWDRTILINSEAAFSSVVETAPNNYVISSSTNAGIGGYKTQSSWDSTLDYWILKLGNAPITTTPAQITNTSQISTYPNPFNKDLNIYIHQQNSSVAAIAITNPLGQTIYTPKEDNLSPNYTKILDLSYLPSGMYFVSVTIDGVQTVRLVVKE